MHLPYMKGTYLFPSTLLIYIDMNISDANSYGDGGISSIKTHNVNKEYEKRLRKAEERLSKTNASKNQPMQMWRISEYHKDADNYGALLGLPLYQMVDVHYFIDNNKMTMGRYKVDDILYHLCLIYGNVDVSTWKILVSPLVLIERSNMFNI